jgi:AraC-like DNA-binding protein
VHQMTRLARSEGFSITEVRISMEAPEWLVDEKHDQLRLVFVRSGTYRLRVADIDSVVDPTVAYVVRPGDLLQIAHKVGVTDLLTSIVISHEFAEQTGVKAPSHSWVCATAGDVDLTQRALVARARRGADEFELSEQLSNLTQLMLGARAHAGASSRTGRRMHTRQKIVDIARELLTENPSTLRLTDLAIRVGASQSYLSRAFHQETGDTLSKFRNRLRVRQALERIEGGECDLARLAAELGFSDHPHLTRTIREEVGGSPTTVRRIFDGTLEAAH